MKIAVYTIAKNEEQFVERWWNSAKDADSIHILDTGSEDKTVTLARDLGVDVRRWKFEQWRFDSARNMSLDMVPDDVDLCVALDMDEVLVEGWREQLERAISDGVTRPRYQYTWSWNKDGSPGLVYGGDKIHCRNGYRWKHPVHEILVPQIAEVQGWYDLEIHHHPDSTKSRSQYLPLLELAVQEDPLDDRNAHYLAREYLYAGRMEEAEREFQRHLNLPTATWKPERARSLRYLYDITKNPMWLHMAIRESPDRREGLVEIAQHYHNEGNWILCHFYAAEALKITERPLEYLTEAFAWGSLPYDLAAIGAYRIGRYEEAAEFGYQATILSPDDSRLVDNYEHYRRAVK